MKILFFETVKSKVIISLFETVRLSVSISPRNLYNSLKSIKEKGFITSGQFSAHTRFMWLPNISLTKVLYGLLISVLQKVLYGLLISILQKVLCGPPTINLTKTC